MDVSQSVKILMLVQQLFLSFIVLLAIVQQDNLTLKTIISSFQSVVLIHLVTNSLNQLELHLGRGRQVTNAVVVILILAVKIFLVIELLANT